jgi:hypothetical protein
MVEYRYKKRSNQALTSQAPQGPRDGNAKERNGDHAALADYRYPFTSTVHCCTRKNRLSRFPFRAFHTLDML